MEEWKQCIEAYEVSNKGNIRKKLLNGVYININGSIMNTGYKYFQLQRDGKRINYFVHQQVALLFIGERPEGLVIDHIDRNKLNNEPSNLRYITQKENTFNRNGVHQHIPQDTPNRQAVVCKEYNERNKEKIKLWKKEKLECEMCHTFIQRTCMLNHKRKCDGLPNLCKRKSGRKSSTV
jgi:hypothetical protein